MMDLYEGLPGLHPSLPINNPLIPQSHKVPAIVIFVNGYRMSMPVGNIIREIRRDDKLLHNEVSHI